jgi:hypothetical protein
MDRLLGEKTLSQDQKQTLDYHKKLQETLTNELAKGASRLKENTNQFTDLLKKDREVCALHSNLYKIFAKTHVL